MELTAKMEPYLNAYLSGKNVERGNLVDNESYITICESFITWYEKREEVFLKNTLEIFRLTNFECGYSALSYDWLKLKSYVKERKFTPEFIKKTMRDKMCMPMIHLYTAKDWKKEQRFSFIGLCIVGYLNVRVEDSEIRDKKNIIVSYGIELNIGDSDHISFLAWQ